MKALWLPLLALTAACQGPPATPAPPDAGVDTAAVDAADTDAAPAVDASGDGASAPEIAADRGPPSLFQPAPATGCKSVHLVAAGGFLYWTDEASGTVMRASTTGGAPTPVAVGEDHPTWLAVRGARVFWTAGGPGTASNGGTTLGRSIRVAAPAGGAAKTIADGVDVHGVTPTDDGENVYFSTGGEIREVSSGGGQSSLVATFSRVMPRGAVAISGATLIALDGIDEQVMLIDLTAGAGSACDGRDSANGGWQGPCRWFESTFGRLPADTILIRGDLAYWADTDAIKEYDVSKTDISWSVVATADATYINALCLGGDRVFFAADDYWLDYPGPEAPPANAGVIEMAPLAPGSISTVLARGQNRPQSIASDGNRVFWSTGDCAIWGLGL